MLDGRSTQIGNDAMLRRPGPASEAGRRPCLRARVKLAMHSLEPLLIDVGINLGRRYVRVAQHLLDDSKISAVAEQMRCEAVPQKVRINIFFKPGALRVLFNDLPNPRCG